MTLSYTNISEGVH